MKTPPHIKALQRVGDLINRMQALPLSIIEGPNTERGIIEWDEKIDNLYFDIKESGAVNASQLENIKMGEAAMAHWESTAKAEKEINEMAGTKKQTEREYALQTLREKATAKIDELAERAVKNVAQTRQSASFSVTVKIEPTGDGAEIKTVTDGRITLSAGQETVNMSLDSQERMDIEPGPGDGG